MKKQTVKRTPSPSAGSASERRVAEAKVRELIVTFSPEHQRLVAAMRRRLRKRLPTAHEVVYEYRDCVVISYSPSERGYEGVLAIRASASGVKFYFNRGKELPDPDRLLRGSGGMARSIDVEAASSLSLPAVANLIEAAIDRNPVPFARTGSGSVVIRTSSAKPRRPS